MGVDESRITGVRLTTNPVYRDYHLFTWCWPRTTPDRISQITILLRPEAS
jgi:hypothetical protein